MLVSKIFKRNRKPLANKIKALLLYFSGLSYRKTGKETYMSHENVRKIFRKARNLLDLIEPKKRKIIAVDETKLDGFYVWVARDIERKEIIALHVSKGRSSLEAYLFVRKVLRKCLGKPELIIVDKGPWYKWVLERFGLNYEYERFGRRNSIESWFFVLKHRTKRFYNCFKRNAKDTGKCVEYFVCSFVSVYNLLLSRGELS
jgi:putative transposase